MIDDDASSQEPLGAAAEGSGLPEVNWHLSLAYDGTAYSGWHFLESL